MLALWHVHDSDVDDNSSGARSSCIRSLIGAVAVCQRSDDDMRHMISAVAHVGAMDTATSVVTSSSLLGKLAVVFAESSGDAPLPAPLVTRANDVVKYVCISVRICVVRWVCGRLAIGTDSID